MPKSRLAVLILLCTVMVSSVLLSLPYTPSLVVRTAVVEVGDLIHSVTVSGVIASRDQQPCISLQPGVVRSVHVQAGQEVTKGQLLFEMDTSAQEEALAALYSMRQELEAGAWPLLTAQQRWEWAKSEQELKQSIAQSRIRAGRDGTVEAVYVSQGAYVNAGGVLGVVSSGEKCIVAAGRAADLGGVKAGGAASLEKLGAAFVQAVHAPDEQGMQQLILLPADPAQLAQNAAGEKTVVEVMSGVTAGCALIPLSAVDAQGRVWVVENGCARSYRVDLRCRNAQMVAADVSWAGRRVILTPPQEMTDGCRVKEAKGR